MANENKKNTCFLVSEKKIYLFVPYEEKDIFKQKYKNVYFDSNKKQWYIFESHPKKDKIIDKYSSEMLKSKEKKDNENKKKIYLFVPYGEKDIFKQKYKNVHFDFDKKEWYIFENHPKKDEILDIYVRENWYDKFGGHGFKCTTTERLKKASKEREEYKKLKSKWLKKNGNLDGFELWYSVNILGHE